MLIVTVTIYILIRTMSDHIHSTCSIVRAYDRYGSYDVPKIKSFRMLISSAFKVDQA